MKLIDNLSANNNVSRPVSPNFSRRGFLQAALVSGALVLTARFIPEPLWAAEGEAARDDDHYSYAAAWEFRGVGNRPDLHKEALSFEYVHPAQRSYK